jgi:hypothetical protein
MERRSETVGTTDYEYYDTMFYTDAYETGWATEARWFVKVGNVSGSGAEATIYPEVSPDGSVWCDEGSTPLVINNEGLYSLALRNFGNWLRLRGELAGTSPVFALQFYLALKE